MKLDVTALPEKLLPVKPRTIQSIKKQLQDNKTDTRNTSIHTSDKASPSIEWDYS